MSHMTLLTSHKNSSVSVRNSKETAGAIKKWSGAQDFAWSRAFSIYPGILLILLPHGGYIFAQSLVASRLRSLVRVHRLIFLVWP